MTPSKGRFGPLIGSIDEGTSSTRFLVFATKTAEVLTYHQIDVPTITPHEGWVEQDPVDILHSVIETINETCENLIQLDISPEDIVAVGITNQRETTVLWDANTGKPLYNALVWLDVRTASTVDNILQNGKRNKNFLKSVCGLPVSTYFSAIKIRWLMDNVEEVRVAINENRCLFGTIDTWLIWNLTGGVNGGLHITDVTNASRTMLMNIETLKWDPQLCKIFDIPMSILPEIRSSSEIYGYLAMSALAGLPVSGCLGDQQAALVGQMCFQQGQAKSTYGTGCFLLYNTGTAIVQSTQGLLTTVGYQLGKGTQPVYALEGSIAIAGAAMQWLRDNLEIIKNVKDSSEMALSVGEVGEVYFVPAFSGLYAPYWRKDARSVICGLSEETKPGHIIKGALESVAFQVRDVLEAMALDCGYPLQKLLVDGGMTANNLLMQMQADYCGIPVVRPLLVETTALGAAIAAGHAKGVEVWDLNNIQPVPSDTFTPAISEDLRDIKYSKWKMAIARSLDWIDDKDEETTGICTTNDLDFVMRHMNNARFVREMDFARIQFYIRTGLEGVVRKEKGHILQTASMIRYRKVVPLFTTYKITTKLLYWEENAFYIEQRFISLKDGFIRAIVMSQQKPVGVSVDEMVTKILRDTSGSKPLPSEELVHWMNSIKISSERLHTKKTG